VSAVISAGGVGYEVRMPVTTASRLPGIGKQARLFTMVVYREDEHALYGFSTKDEREFFRLLVEKVSGIGPKIALALMSKLSLPLLAGAIAGGDINLLAQTPGIGKKTAERIVVELRDKVLPGAAASSGTSATRVRPQARQPSPTPSATPWPPSGTRLQAPRSR
jgi:Holliday junction DNA helicase RuvA